MSTKDDLIEMSRKLETIINSKDKQQSHQVMDILNVLKVVKIDPILIRSAKIILTVNNLRKRISDEEVVKVSKNLLISWKKAVIIENNEIKNYLLYGSNPTFDSNTDISRRAHVKNKIDIILKSGTMNETRIKSRELLLKALLSDNELKEDIFKVVRIAIDIERHIYNEFQNTETKYKTRVRSRIANLSDDQNSDLRLRVLNGSVKVAEIAQMSVEDMATDRMKQLRQQFHEESISANLLPEVFGTTSELLKCPECKKNTCSYNQVQIDRADEPMTTLCLCISCGHRWRFN